VVQAIKEYSAAFPMADKYGFIDIDRIKADAGPEFASDDFQQFYIKNRINLLLAAPKRQDSNHLAERSWQTIHRMARSMLLVKNLYNSEGERCSPFELFIGTKPTISHLRVFGCPVVAKRSVITIDDLTTKHRTEKGIRGFFIGIPANQKGYLIYLPGSRTIACSGDVKFDETFYSAIATTWRRFEEGIALKPQANVIPGPNMELEETGDVSNIHDSPEEHMEVDEEINVAPNIFDDGLPLNPRPQRNRRAPRRLSFDIYQPDRDWTEVARACQDIE